MCENMPPSLTGKSLNYTYSSSNPYDMTHTGKCLNYTYSSSNPYDMTHTGKCLNYTYSSSNPYDMTHKHNTAILFSSLSQQTCITNLKILQFWTIQQFKIFYHFECAVHQFRNQASSLVTQLWVKYKRNYNDTWKMLRWSYLTEPSTTSSWYLGQEGVVWRYKLHTFLTGALRENPEQHLLRMN